MLTEKEYQRLQVEKEAKRQNAQRFTRGEVESGRVYNYAPPPPANATARQKLDFANAIIDRRDTYKEPPLTDAERGMSQGEFDRLPARRRNDIYSDAMFERRRKVSS